MTSSETASPKQKPSRAFRARRLLAFGLVGCGIFVAIAFHFRNHLMWRYTERRLGLQNVRAIPDSPMPETAVPDAWELCGVDLMEFRLPPEMAANRENAPRGFPGFGFTDETRDVFVARDPTDMSSVLDLATAISPRSERFTLPRLRLACYRADARDFRWSMTPAEAGWHTHLMVTGRLLRPDKEGRAETLFRDDLDGLLHFIGDRATFDWQCRNGTHRGFIQFRESNEPLDPEWVRAVCRSFRVSCDADPQPP